ELVLDRDLDSPPCELLRTGAIASRCPYLRSQREPLRHAKCVVLRGDLLTDLTQARGLVEQSLPEDCIAELDGNLRQDRLVLHLLDDRVAHAQRLLAALPFIRPETHVPEAS